MQMLSCTFFTAVVSIFVIGGNSSNIIQPIEVEPITKDITLRDTEHLLDNNRDTQSLIYSDLHQKTQLRLKLASDYQIESFEFISDDPSQFTQSVWIGYGATVASSLKYECVANKTSTICLPPCKSAVNTREGVVGSSILWTIERIVQKGWTRIYDVIIKGRPLEEIALSYGRNGDLIFLKPYTIDDAQSDTCTDPIWKLTDSSMADSGMTPVATTHRSVTFHFGRTCLVNRVALIRSASGPNLEQTLIEFGGPRPFSKVIKFAQDCQPAQSTENGMLVCEMDDISGYPFTNVTLDAMGFVRFHVYGMPLLYPRIGIVPSPKNADPESMHRLQLKCVALPCNSNVVMKLSATVHGKPLDPCSRQGWASQCKNMELLRVHEAVSADVGLPDTVLVSNGQILPPVQDIMTEMSLVESSPNRLIVSVPRTHPYYGQYKCRCQADDKIDSMIESTQTSLPPTEFDQDLVFQRNYSAVFDDLPIASNLGFLELPDDPQISYFRLVIAAHSLTEKIELNATFLESGQFASMTGDYARITSVPAFPRATGATYAWPISAYRIELQEAWPDAVDGEAITIEFSTADQAVNVKKVQDTLRTIVLSSSRDGLVRGWIWARDSHQLDIRAYYQTGNTNPKPVEFYLQRSGCSANGGHERVGSVRIDGHQCLTPEGPVTALCVKSTAGFAVQFVVNRPSGSDTYDLFAQFDVDNESDKQPQQLANSPAAATAASQNMHSELQATDISLKIVALRNDASTDSTLMDVLVVVHSKTVVDNSACRRMYLTLHPAWPVEQRLEETLSKNETRFQLPVPNDQRLITMDLELRIDADGDDNSGTSIRRSLTIPNPRFYAPELRKDDATGKIEWSPLPLPFRGLLDHFEVKLFRTDRVCGMREELQPPPIREDYNGATSYKLQLSDMSEFESDMQVEYEAEITPVLKSANANEPIHGAVAIAELAKGKIGQSLIKQHVPLTSRSARFYVLPSQMASCLRGNQAMTITFELHVIGEDQATPDYVNDVVFEADHSEGAVEIGRWYIAKNLQPGRRYEIRATVHYPTGEKDQPSPFISFWTADELSVSTVQAFVSPGERVVFTCTGSVGPENRYRKRLEWRREDGTPLPDGSRVETSADSPVGPAWNETISLIFDRIESEQANTYACFIRPSVLEILGKQFTPPKVKMSVTELDLDMQSHVAAYGEAVTVTCSSEQAGELAWLTSAGQPVPLAGAQSSDPFITTPDSGSATQTLQLHIPRADLSHTGEYVCTQNGGQSTRSFSLRLSEDIQLNPGAGYSDKAAEKLSLNCTAQLGHSSQQIVWYKRSSPTAPWVPLASLTEQFPSMHVRTEPVMDSNRYYSSLSWINSPSSNGQFACAIEEKPKGQMSDSEFVQTKLHLPKSSAIYEPKTSPVINLEQLVSKSEHEVTLKCTGHPAHESDRLNWFFLPEGQSEERAIPLEPELHTESDNYDAQLIELIRKTFRPGDYTPASWPGAAGPVLLAASGKLSPRMVQSGYSTPESLELLVTGPVDERLKTGQLICHYRRPSALVLIKDDVSLVSSGSLSSQDSTSAVQKRIAMREISDALTGEATAPASGRAGDPITDGDDNDDGKGNGTDSTLLVCRFRATWMTFCLTIYLLVYHV